jgi:hypothetical protein
MREIVFKVTLKVDDEVAVAEAKEYALDALQSMGGCRHPEDPFFGMQDRVKVVLLTRAGGRR